MPKEKYIYPIPYEYYEKYGVRKYGAHGTSHKYLAQEAKKYTNEKYVLNNTTLFVSYGIGTSNISFRLFNKPSFNLYRIVK